jgi:hypothetical protein
MSERWLPIPGFEGYEASDQGGVRSQGQCLTRYSNGDGTGYQWVYTRFGKLYVHHAVLTTFRGPAEVGQESRHYDGNDTNNRLENLLWGTRSENTLDQVRLGVHNNASKTHCKHGHEYTPENTYINPRGSRECQMCRRDRRDRWKEQWTNSTAGYIQASGR